MRVAKGSPENVSLGHSFVYQGGLSMPLFSVAPRFMPAVRSWEKLPASREGQKGCMGSHCKVSWFSLCSVWAWHRDASSSLKKGVVFIWFYMYLIWIYDDLWSFEAPVSPCQVESRALHHLPDGSLTTGRLMSFAVSDTERGQLATCALWVLGSTLPSEEPSGPYRGFSFACSQANQGSTVITNILPIYYTNILPHITP